MTMYAVVKTGGKQYRVAAGATLVVEKLDGEPGSAVTFDRVLLVGDGEQVTVGTPTVAGASVNATVLSAHLGEKIIVFKFKPKVKYRRRTGHRQRLTLVRIDSISADGKVVKAEAPVEAEAHVTAPKAEKAPKRPRAAKAAAAPTGGEGEASTTESTAAESQVRPKPARAAARPRRAAGAVAETAGSSEPKPVRQRPARPKPASEDSGAETTEAGSAEQAEKE
jgi:large subunit ribosomal protein L21